MVRYRAHPCKWGAQTVVSRARKTLGAAGAIVEELCCAGTPFIVAGLTGMGLRLLRSDAIVWPLMLISLAVMTMI